MSAASTSFRTRRGWCPTLWLVLFAWLAIVGRAGAEPHTFTDASGRTIVAEIMEATETSVRIRRDDGRVFEIALATLTEADRTFVAAWRTERDFAFGGIAITAHRVRLDADRTVTRVSTKKTEDWCYRIAIANESRAELEGLTVEYRLFYLDDSGKGDRDDQPTKRQNGRATIGTLAPGTSTDVQSSVVTLQIVRPKPGSRSRERPKRRIEDSLAGIWVRVMRQGEVVHEFADPTTLLKSQAW